MQNNSTIRPTSRPINSGYYRKQAGLSLLELSLGLAIVLAIAAVAIGIYTVTSASQRSSDAQTQLLQITAATRSTGTNGNFFNIDATTLAKAKKVPAAWIGDDTDPAAALTNPFGGFYEISPASWDGAAATACAAAPCNAFQIEATDLPASACNELANSAAANFVVISVGGTTVKDPATALDAGDLADACNNDTNDVTFTVAG